MGLAGTKANSDRLLVSFGCQYIFWMSIYFSNAYLKNFLKYIYSTLFN